MNLIYEMLWNNENDNFRGQNHKYSACIYIK